MLFSKSKNSYFKLAIFVIGGVVLAPSQAMAQVSSYWIPLKKDAQNNPLCTNCTLQMYNTQYTMSLPGQPDQSPLNHQLVVRNRENGIGVKWHITYIEYTAVSGGRARSPAADQFLKKQWNIKSTGSDIIGFTCLRPAYEYRPVGTTDVSRYITITNKADTGCEFYYSTESFL